MHHRSTPALLSAFLLATACGGGQVKKASDVNAAHKTWDDQTATTPPAEPAIPLAAPRATPGEHMAYKLSLAGLEVASFTVDVGQTEAVDKLQGVPIMTRARSAGVAKLVKNVDMHFTSWLDPANGRPLRFESEEKASAKDEEVERIQWNFFAKTDAGYPVSTVRADTGKLDEVQLGVVGELWDFNAFLIALRSWTPTPGTMVTFDVARSRFMWRTQITAAAPEHIMTELGELPALRFDGVAKQIERGGKDATDEDQRHFSIWVSDDADRVPIALAAHTDYGDIKMEIVEYGGSGN